MKNSKLISLALALAVALVGCSPALDDSPVEVPVSEKDVSLRDIAIREYLFLQNDFSWETEAGSARECVFENLNPKNELFPLELWIYCSEYRFDGEHSEKLSGVSMPILLDYPNEFSFFALDKFTHEVPRDGAFFAEDVREIFSATAQKKIFDSAIIDELEKRWGNDKTN